MKNEFLRLPSTLAQDEGVGGVILLLDILGLISNRV